MNDTLRVADEAWVATALLHREHPDRNDFTVKEIVRRAEQVAVPERLRPGVRMHVSYHAVANKKPNPGRYCLLFETARGRRRLFRPGDPRHPERLNLDLPGEERLPPAYRSLITWYRTEYAGDAAGKPADPILSLRGLGKEIWTDEHADAYVRRLREGWS